MKRWKVIPILCLSLVMAACSSLENQARDTAAALNGTINAAQSQHETECTANPQAPTCALITRGVAGQNALVTAVQTYCGWSATTAPPDPNTQCVPVKGAEGALKAAITNAQQLTTEIKGTVKP